LNIANSYTEQELVSALKERDAGAFNYLYDQYSAALYTIVKQIVQHGETANDVLQEVFVNIWRKIESYDPAKGRLFTWMLNIARNASIDTLRSKSFQNTQKNHPITEIVDNARAFSWQANIDSIGIKKVVQKLKPEYRVLVELAYFKGYTHEEIAEIEDLPLGTVKTRIRNALIQLRSYLS
jgi:RNA polymerase sigma-70 factor (ECF subfamily)